MPDGGTYTFCPNCKYLSWAFPPNLTPFQQEGFPTVFSVAGELTPDKAQDFITSIQTRLKGIGCTFDFELNNRVNDASADLAAQWHSLKGVINGMVQKELTSWPFDPNEVDEDGNSPDVDRMNPEYFEEIIDEALEEMIDNYGSDGWESTREYIQDQLAAITYDGKPVEIEVGPGEWTGKG